MVTCRGQVRIHLGLVIMSLVLNVDLGYIIVSKNRKIKGKIKSVFYWFNISSAVSKLTIWS